MDLRILRLHLRPRRRRPRRRDPGRARPSRTSRRTGTARSAAPVRRTSRLSRAESPTRRHWPLALLRDSASVKRREGLALPLEALVFAVGMSTLGAEIAAQRLMAPFFGSSTVIWANTIAIVLLALSVGYWLGGRLADRRPRAARAATGSCCSGSALLAVVPFIAHPFLSLSVSAFDDLSVGAFTASLFGTLVLVAVPLLLLGTVSPWATRMKLATVEESGVGRGAAVRDLHGRLAGRRVLRLAVGDRGDRDAADVPGAGARCPALVSGLRLGGRCVVVPVVAPRGARAPGRARPSPPTTARVLYETETPYQYARVVEQEDGDAQARAQRGPGDPLAVAARHGAHRRLLGRLPGAAVRDRLRAPAGADRRARHRGRHGPARVRALLPGHARSTPSTSTRSCSRSGAATSGWRRGRSCASTPRTRGRSCARRASATTRSSSTPTASRTSRST